MSPPICLSDLACALASADEPRAVIARLLAKVADKLIHKSRPQRTSAEDGTWRLARELAVFARELETSLTTRTMREEIELLRERLVRDALEASSNNITLAARRLAVSRNLIYAIIERARLP